MPRLPLAIAMLACVTLIDTASAQQPAPPGQFDYYLLTLSWSPAYCLSHRSDPKAREECGRRRGFVVHGLWPQNEDGSWPAFCRAVPPVPRERVAREVAIMPNAELVEHEWEKHGSCTTLSVDDYFSAIDSAFTRLRIPPALIRPTQPVALSLADAKRLLMAANAGLDAGMFSMRCTHSGEVDEMRLCLDKSFNYRPCGAGAGDSCPSATHFDPIAGGRP